MHFSALSSTHCTFYTSLSHHPDTHFSTLGSTHYTSYTSLSTHSFSTNPDTHLADNSWFYGSTAGTILRLGWSSKLITS
jgi:hypothetical protein